MEIVAVTKDGALINATSAEIYEIINSVTGKRPDKVSIGQKIPAIDYATSITKLKTLKDDYSFTSMKERLNIFKLEMDKLFNSIENAANISID